MIKSIGTFTAALIVATTMAVSTAAATQVGANLIESSPPIPSVRSSSIVDPAYTPHTRLANEGLIHQASEGSVWNASSHMRAWQSLFMRSHRDDGDAEQLIFNFSGSSIAHNEVKARDSQALWILDDIKLVAPAFGNLWPLPASVSRPSESIDHITRIVGADVDASLLDDAAQFYTLVKDLAWAPSIWADEGEIGFEWIRGDKHAIVSIDGGGSYGYTLLRGEAFEPGAYEDPRVSFLPQDLREYLEVA